MSRKYGTATIRNDTEYNIALNDNISPIRDRVDELEDRVTALEKKGNSAQRKTKHRRIVIKL